jgi:hypothetical protein
MSSVPVYAINTSCRSAECLRRWPMAPASASTAGQYKTKPPNLQKIQTTTKQGKPYVELLLPIVYLYIIWYYLYT